MVHSAEWRLPASAPGREMATTISVSTASTGLASICSTKARGPRVELPAARAVAAAGCHSSILRWVNTTRTSVTTTAWAISAA